jgi:mono/diheme cytochrome c family protein
MRVLAGIGMLAIIVAGGAAVFFFGGFYSVAGTARDPGLVRWALIQVRTASIIRHAKSTSLANLNEPATVQAGAREFAEYGCANCHGAPGVEGAKFSEGLRPYPPDLTELVNDRTPSQLFWVIKNGINMTGMPSFGLAGATDKDIQSIVVFLKKLPEISETDYKVWTAPSAPPVLSPVAATPPPAETPASAQTPPARNQ